MAIDDQSMQRLYEAFEKARSDYPEVALEEPKKEELEQFRWVFAFTTDEKSALKIKQFISTQDTKNRSFSYSPVREEVEHGTQETEVLQSRS